MKNGMKSATMPKDHHEKAQKQAPTCNSKYAGEMSNPSDLDKSTAGLANYVKKNKMKY